MAANKRFDTISSTKRKRDELAARPMRELIALFEKANPKNTKKKKVPRQNSL